MLSTRHGTDHYGSSERKQEVDLGRLWIFVGGTRRFFSETIGKSEGDTVVEKRKKMDEIIIKKHTHKRERERESF